MNLSNLQQAVYDRLDDQVGASFVAIYHDAEQATQSEDDSAFPYITLAYLLSPFDDKTQTGATVVLQVHVWHRTHNNLDRAALYDAIYAALHRHTLAITGTDYADCLFESQDEFPDPDGKTRHGVARYRVTYLNT